MESTVEDTFLKNMMEQLSLENTNQTGGSNLSKAGKAKLVIG